MKKWFIQTIISILENINNFLSPKDFDDKFTNKLFFDNYQVLTNNGFQDLKGIGKTIPFNVWVIKTELFKLECSDNHLLVLEDGSYCYVKNLQKGNLIQTIIGLQKIISIEKTNKVECMYDLLDVDDSLYYTNKILSHNSTIYAIYCCHFIIFNDNKTCGILANKGEVAREILSRVKMGYENLPKWLQQGVIEWNKGSIELENNSRCITAGTTPDAFSGYTLNVLIMDEISKMPRNIFMVLLNSLLPTVVSGTTGRVIGVSTPLGDNFFKDLWKKALQNLKTNGELGNEFTPLEFTHMDIPERATEEFVRKQIKLLGKSGYLQEHCGRFTTLSNTLIDGYFLAKIISRDPILYNEYPPELMKISKYKEFINLYDFREEGEKYIISCDPNESQAVTNSKISESVPHGIGIHVLRMTRVGNIKQVCTIFFPSGEINYLELPLIIYSVANYYNKGWVFFENNVAKEVINTVESQFFYENIYRSPNGLLGYRLTKANKPILCKILKLLVESKLFEISDNDTISQLKTFLDNLYKAFAGYPDDLVTSLIGCLYPFILPANELEGMELVLPNYMGLLKEVLRECKDEESSELFDIIVDAERLAETELLNSLNFNEFQDPMINNDNLYNERLKTDNFWQN